MRKALIGLLIATTAASPLAAQDNGWHGRNGDRPQRSEGQRAPRQAPQQAPQGQRQAPQGQRQGGWQGRQQVQAAPQAQVQQQYQARGYRQGYQGQQTTQGYRAQAYDGTVQSMPERYQRRAAENAARYGGQVRTDQYRQQGYSGYQGQRSYQGQRGYDAYRGGRSGVQWNRSWRNDNRYDWQRYRYSNRGLFSVPYYAPRGYGYGYNRLSIGLILDPIFFGQNYWIGDPWQYRLPAAPYGTRWVRYYNDVLLIDEETGEVVDAIYDFFW